MEWYYWLSLPVYETESESESCLLFEDGCAGIEEQDAAGPGGASQGLVLKATFESEAPWLNSLRRLEARPGLAKGREPVIDWDLSWRLQQKPVRVTEFLQVVPPWVDPLPGIPHCLRLEAKMAFGTGSHESTRLCVQLMSPDCVEGRQILDVGTGTGILGLHAAQLGARRVTGLDIDPAAGPCLRENSDLNAISPVSGRTLESVGFYIGGMEALKAGIGFDLILCNMIRTELWPFREELIERLNPSGRLIVSGQLKIDRHHFESWSLTRGWRLEAEVEENEWWAFRAVRNGDHYYKENT